MPKKNKIKKYRRVGLYDAFLKAHPNKPRFPLRKYDPYETKHQELDLVLEPEDLLTPRQQSIEVL